ncbi:MAG TPA: SPOR domain-containing protein [Rhodocyclaceae bacterium]|nr:SPOR domain-containing protein [Rhodocyclaceae bacterium]
MAKPLPPKPPMPPRPTYPASPQSTSRGGTLLGLFIGLVVGVLIAFGVVWFLNKSPLPFLNKHEPPVKNGKAEKDAEAAAAPLPLPGKPGDKPKDKQRFEFYGILEGKQPANGGAPTAAATTDSTVRAATTTTRSTPTTTTATTPQAADVATATAAIEGKEPVKEIFYLQAGAFQKAVDADQLRAKLALTGLETSVQEVNIRDKGAMHRVRSGPFHSHEEMNRARNQLAQAGVQTSIIKQKE